MLDRQEAGGVQNTRGVPEEKGVLQRQGERDHTVLLRSDGVAAACGGDLDDDLCDVPPLAASQTYTQVEGSQSVVALEYSPLPQHESRDAQADEPDGNLLALLQHT